MTDRRHVFGESWGWWLVLVTLSFLSWIASTEGLLGMLGDERAQIALIVYALWGVFQIGMAKSVIELSSPNTQLRKRPLFLGIYLTILPFSVILSISFYFSIFGAEEFGEDLFRTNFERVETTAESTQRAYNDIGSELLVLADAAREKARIEDQEQGGTCPTSPGRGRGPAYHKRMYEQAHFGVLASNFDRRSEGLGEVRQRLELLSQDSELELPDRLAQLRSIQAELVRIQRDVQALDLHEQIRKQRQYERYGYPRSGSRDYDVAYSRFQGFACEDPETLALLDNVLRVTLPSPHEVPIDHYDPRNRSHVNNIVANDVLNAVIAFFSGEDLEDSPVLTDQRYRVPVALGLFVDGWLLLIGVAIGLGQSRVRPKSGIAKLSKLFSGLISIYEADQRSGDNFLSGIAPPRNAEVREAVAFTRSMLDRLLVECGEKSYLFLPREHVGDVQIGSERGRRFVELLKHVYTLLDLVGVLGLRARSQTTFEAHGLDGLKDDFGLSDHDIGPNGQFDVYLIDPKLFHLLINFQSTHNGFVAEARRSFAPITPPNPDVEDAEAHMLELHKKQRALFVLNRIRKRGSNWEAKLSDASGPERVVRDWLLEFRNDVSEFRLIEGMWPWSEPHWQLSEDFVKRLTEFTRSIP